MRNLLLLLSLALLLAGGGLGFGPGCPGIPVSAGEAEWAQGGVCATQKSGSKCVCYNGGNSCNAGGCGVTSIQPIVLGGSVKQAAASDCDMNKNCQASQSLTNQNCGS